MFYVYALLSKKFDRIYIGLTQDVRERIKEHNSSRVKSTKQYVPWELFHYEKFDTRLKARNREKRLKTSSGRKLLKGILSNSTAKTSL
jgi:putative endonuclease